LVKPEHISTPCLLQPLPIPTAAWSSIGIDFIIWLPMSEGKNIIMVIVDRLTKYAHFLPLAHPYTAFAIVHLFFYQIYKLHGLPTSIVTDSDLIFTISFWKEPMKLLGVKLNMSSFYHPQSDSQTERINQCLENYLRSMLIDGYH
jgi:E3 ubiquitin-protein ligase DOA10